MAKHIYYIKKHPDCKQSGDDCIPKTKTEQELAVELGMTQQGIHKRKKKILEILKNLVVKSKNFQQ